MPLTVHTTGSVTVLCLEPVLTGASGAELLAQLDATPDRNLNWLLDMTAVAYIDSAGLGALLDTYKRILARGGSLKFVNVQPRGRYLFAITGLSGVFDSFDTEAAALASFVPATIAVVPA